MSSKNKIENKSLRRLERLVNPFEERIPVSAIAQKTSARVLSNPKGKMTGATRRRLQKSRGFVLARGVHQASIDPAVKVTLKLQALPMTKLIRRLKQAARRSATCGNLIRNLHAGSKFLAGLQAEQTHQLSLCRQVSAEIEVRNHNTQH